MLLSERQIKDFRDSINSCGLLYPGYIGPDFTRCNNHFQTDLIWERLDIFFLNNEMQMRCRWFKVWHLALLASDHQHILAEWTDEDGVLERETRKHTQFSLKNHGLNMLIVKNLWNKSGMNRDC